MNIALYKNDMIKGKKYKIKTSQPRRSEFIGILKDYTYDIYNEIEGYIFQLEYGTVYVTKSTFKSATLIPQPKTLMEEKANESKNHR